jgi:[ribosomal protein S5]-alanine N-acetyltransferase
MSRENPITERLILKPVSDEYKFDICREFTTEVTEYMPFTPNGDIKVTENFIEQSNEELSEGKGITLSNNRTKNYPKGKEFSFAS